MSSRPATPARRRRRGGAWGIPLAVLLAAPVLAAAYPSALRIPREKGEEARMPTLPQALFSHRTHASFACFVCHPSTFPQAPVAFTHADMNEGRRCGHCHNGTVAFAVAGTACERCHAPGR